MTAVMYALLCTAPPQDVRAGMGTYGQQGTGVKLTMHGAAGGAEWPILMTSCLLLACVLGTK